MRPRRLFECLATTFAHRGDLAKEIRSRPVLDPWQFCSGRPVKGICHVLGDFLAPAVGKRGVGLVAPGGAACRVSRRFARKRPSSTRETWGRQDESLTLHGFIATV